MSFMRQWLYTCNRPEPLRQATLLLMLSGAVGRGECVVSVLRAHQRATRGSWSDSIAQLATLIESGHSPGTALMLVEELLPRPVIAALAGAEGIGASSQVMRDEADRLIQQMTERGPGQSILLISTAASAGVLMAMLAFQSVFVLPKFKAIFGDFGVRLPSVTLRLLSFGDWLDRFWYYLVLPGVCFAGWAVWFCWKNAQHQMINGSPLFAGNRPRYWVPALLRIFSNAVASGTPFTAGMNALIQQLPAGAAATRMFELRTCLENGESVPDALAKTHLLGKRNSAFLRASAASGHLDWGLRQLADHLEQRRMRRAERLRSLLIFGFHACISLLVLWFALAFFLPMVKLLTDLS